MPPVIDKSKCIKCGTCAQICCVDVYGPMDKNEGPIVRYPDECWHCRACVMDCPVGAIDLRYPLSYMLLYADSPKKDEMKGADNNVDC